MKWPIILQCIFSIAFTYESSCQELSYLTLFGSRPDSSVVNLRNWESWRNKNADTAYSLAVKTLQRSRIHGDQQTLAISLNMLGSLEFDKRNFMKSKAYFHEALRSYTNSGLSSIRFLSQVYMNLAGVYSCMGYNDSAVHYQYLCMACLNGSKTKDSSMFMAAYNNLSWILFNSEEDSLALFYIRKALNLSYQYNDTGMLERNYRNIGTYFFKSGQKREGEGNIRLLLNHIDSARRYYNLALSINKRQGMGERTQISYYQIALTWLLQGDLKLAKTYLDSAFAVSPESFYYSPELQKGFGDYYLLSGQYKSAIPYYSKAQEINLLQGNDRSNWNLELYQVLALCFEKAGDGRSAYQYQKSYTDLREKLYNDEKARTINNLELKYRTLEKDKELASQKTLLLQKENNIRNKNTWIIVITGCSILLTLFALYFYHNRQKLNKEKIERIHRQNELNRLHASIQAEEEERSRIARDLHDSLGVLLSAALMNYTVLSGELAAPAAASKSYNKGLELLQEMKKTIRGIAHNLIPGAIAHQNLAKSVQNLCAKLGQNNPVEMEVEIYGMPTLLKPERNLSVYRMVEEAIQNVLKHAKATKVVIQLLFHQHQLNMLIQDNGIGFDTGMPYEGIGLQNLRSRAGKLNGEISILSVKGEGTVVELEIPYKD